MTLAPNFPTSPYVYVLYTYDHELGSTAPAPRWGTPGVYSDPCPTPPGATAEPFVVTRGWMDPQNRLRPDRSQPVTQGRLATYRWVLQPKDYVFPAGHRIGLVVFSSDQEYTLLPLGGTRLTVDPGSSRVTIPVVGGTRALG
jgi:hypothetical protein